MSRASAEFESQHNRNDCFFWAHNRMVDGGVPRFLVNPNSAVQAGFRRWGGECRRITYEEARSIYVSDDFRFFGESLY